MHFHLIIGGVTGVGSCKISESRSKDWYNPDCGCIQCVMCRVWHDVTGDSYIVDVRRVYDPAGAASYLVKYLTKGMYGKAREELESRGFDRRYARSRNWPSGSQMQRRGTLEKRWLDTNFQYRVRYPFLENASRGHPLMEQVGSDIAKAFKLRKDKKKSAALYEKIRRR